MKKAVILLSGGLDSVTVTAIAKKDYQIYALSFFYGQRIPTYEIYSRRPLEL